MQTYPTARQLLAPVGITPAPFWPSKTLRGGLVWRFFRNGQSYEIYEATAPTVERCVGHANAVDAERRVNPCAFGGAA